MKRMCLVYHQGGGISSELQYGWNGENWFYRFRPITRTGNFGRPERWVQVKAGFEVTLAQSIDPAVKPRMVTLETGHTLFRDL